MEKGSVPDGPVMTIPGVIEIDPDGCCILHTDGGYKYHDQDQGTGDITGIFFVHEIPHFSCVMTSLSVKMHKKTRRQIKDYVKNICDFAE